MLPNEKAKRQGRSQRNAGPGVRAVHDGSHVIAAAIESGDRIGGCIQHPSVPIGIQARRGSQVTGKHRNRKVRWSVDRSHARVRLHFGVAEVPLVVILPASILRITPVGGGPIVSL